MWKFCDHSRKAVSVVIEPFKSQVSKFRNSSSYLRITQTLEGATMVKKLNIQITSECFDTLLEQLPQFFI